VTHATASPGEQTLAAVAPLGNVQTEIAGDEPYVTLQSTWDAYASAVGYVWTATQQPPFCTSFACSTQWTAYVSPAVLGAQPAFRMPDLADLDGWKEAWQLSPASKIAGSVTAVVSSGGAGDFPTGTPLAGTDRLFARSDYGISP
jgi:hypothetical protein